MTYTNNQSARAAYDIAKKNFYDARIGSFGGNAKACWDYVNGLKLSQSEIRLETGINTTNTLFTFGVTANQANSSNTVYKTENRLKLQDTLNVSEYGIFVAQPASDADTAYPLNTYGNGNVFAVADAAALNTDFYSNGYLTAKANNDVIIPYRGLFAHQYIPQTQQIAALGAAAVHSQIRGAEDGFVTMEPNFLLSGSKDNVPQIILPAALASMAAFARVVLIFRGILAQNSTVVN